MSQLMNELGLAAEKINLEHTLVIATSKVLEAQLNCFVKGSSKKVAHTIEVIGYGVAAYCVLSGKKIIIISTS